MVVVILLALLAGFFGFLAWQFRLRILAYERVHAEIRNQREAAVDLLNRIGFNINANLDLEGPLETITEYLVESTYAESGAIFLLENDGKVLQARTVVGLFPPMHHTIDYVVTKQKYLKQKIKHDKIEMGEGIIGFVAKTGEAVLIPDAMNDPRVPKTSTDFLQIQSMMVSPMQIRQKIVGVFAVVNKKRGGPFDEQDLRLLNQLSTQAALTVDIVRLYEHQEERRRIERELSLAKDFQRMLLPRSLPGFKGLDLAAISQPALEIGGDYYDLFWLEPDKKLAVTVVDVSGKSIPAALVVAVIRSTLRAEATLDASPVDVLRRVNRHLLEDTTEQVFATVSYGILDVENKKFRFARAGHEPLIIFGLNREEPITCMPDGIAMGMVDDVTFSSILQECEIQLEEGDTAVLYTDGVIEAIDTEGHEYGSPRFIQTMQRQLKESAQNQIQYLMQDIHAFTSGIEQHDDITLVSMKIDNSSGA